jgi:hypothetical protein
LGHAGQLIERGDFNKAAAYLENAEAKTLRIWRAMLNSYLAAHRFEELCLAYERIPAEHKNDFDCRHLYLLAAANLRRFDIVEHIIEDVLSGPDSDQASSFLSKVYLFAERLGPEVRQKVVNCLVSHRSWLAAEHFDAILKSAHHLRGRGAKADALQLEEALRKGAGDNRSRMKLDVYDGQIQFLEGRYDLQLAAVNRLLARQALDSIDLIDSGAPLACENLKSISHSRPVVRGPRVSILMPAYNSEDTIGYALESLRRQTYQDIEVIIVDDASTDATARVAAQFGVLDPRFRIIDLKANSGAFIARNVGLAAAVGEYVTNQDADDWAHPQKIATAVGELQQDSSLVATWVEHVRCSSQKGFRALSGYIRPDASSLMFRREPVMHKIGWYDSVRAAGDGEFHLRMERSFGRYSIKQIEKLLSFVRWSDNSLSGGGVFQIDNDLGIFSPSRSSYRRSFGLWHETADRLYMPFPLQTRPFPVPETLQPG